MNLTRIIRLMRERNAWRAQAMNAQIQIADLSSRCAAHLLDQQRAEKEAALLRADLALAHAMLRDLRTPTTPQRTVFENVKARGYLDGWTPKQAMTRQLSQMGEELGELAELVRQPSCAEELTGRGGSSAGSSCPWKTTRLL